MIAVKFHTTYKPHNTEIVVVASRLQLPLPPALRYTGRKPEAGTRCFLRLFRIFCAALLAAAISFGSLASVWAQSQATGLPLPRFVSIASDKVNARTGPSSQYPIRWVYTRENLPLKIVDEFDNWRQVVDHENEGGWILASLLSSKRTAVVTAEIADMRRTPSLEARIVVRAKEGVIARLFNCEPVWCLVEIGEQRGWLQRDQLWGVLDDEWVE